MAGAAITGMGLATSLGVDAVTACAAARAGLSRPALLPVSVLSQQDDDPEPVVGYPVSLADGFDGVGRLLRVLHLALADLTRTADADVLREAHWLIALPEGLPAEPPPEMSDLDAPPVEATPPESPRITSDAVLRAVESVAGPLPPHRFATFAGAVGFIEALGHASRLAEQGRTVVVGAIDSLVDSAVVEALHVHGRLRAPGAGVGLQPGEAGVFVVVQPDGGATVLGRLGAGALGWEAAHLYSGRPPLGLALAEVADRTTVAADPETVWAVTDSNGEAFVGADWGHAVARSACLRAGLGAALYPATSVGDTGAARAGVGLAFVLRAFARGYAPAPTALLLASAATGARGALLVSAP